MDLGNNVGQVRDQGPDDPKTDYLSTDVLLEDREM